jgi:DHA1 family purine ribonucleoside efflux pump-like MFS transporter
MVIAAPIGSFLGARIGWRGVFAAAAGLGILCVIWQALTMPSLQARGRGHARDVFALLKRPGVALPMLAIFTVFAGQLAFFTYTRPFLEQTTALGVSGVSAILLLFGIANFVGTSLSSLALKRSLKLSLALAPLVLACCAACLVLFGSGPIAVAAIFIVWGLTFGLIPVGWSTWVAQYLGDDAENGGGLQVATIQLANTAGAAAGGLVFELSGVIGPVQIGGLLFALTFALVCAGVSTRRSSAPVNA